MYNLINKIYRHLWSPVFSKVKSLITTSLKGNHYLECNVVIELFSFTCLLHYRVCDPKLYII